MLIIHIIIALTSLTLAIGLAVKPHQFLLKVNFGFIAATLGTGVALVAYDYSAVHVCAMGLIYTGVSLALSTVSRRTYLMRTQKAS